MSYYTAMRTLSHVVQITADNNTPFAGTLVEKPPAWAKFGRLQLVSSDSDWTFAFRAYGEEGARDSGPHRTQADNVQQLDWDSPHIMFPVKAGVDPNISCPINVVTAGVGILILEWCA